MDENWLHEGCHEKSVDTVNIRSTGSTKIIHSIDNECRHFSPNTEVLDNTKRGISLKDVINLLEM